MSSSWAQQSWLLAVMLLTSSIASGASIGRRSNEQFRPWSLADQSLCAMGGQRVALVGDQLFFMSGEYNFIGEKTEATKPKLFTLRLNQTFSVSGYIPGDQLYSSAVPSNVSWNTTDGVFFYDNTTLYMYAGLSKSDDSATNHLWAYHVLNSLWEKVTVAGGNFQHGSRGGSIHTSIPGTGMSFLSGGMDGDTSGILRFSSSDHTSLSWENDTSFIYDDPESPGPLRGEGQLIFVPVGEQGVLISIGGYNTAEHGSEYDNYPWSDAPMTSVDVYDIASSEWYNVTTSGDSPSDRGVSGRSLFSSWMTPAPDRSSYTITIYGGWNLFRGKSYEDIYVLSIPSFTWIKIDDTSNVERESLGGLGRRNHRGLKWKEDSGFVIGGFIKNDTADVNADECNSVFSPIRLLNLTSYNWISQYDPNNNSPYRVNSQIYNVIGGGSLTINPRPSGSATATAPSGGWGSKALETVFSKRYDVPSAPSNLFAQAVITGSSGPVNSSVTEVPSQSSSSITGGVIAGAVVGAVIGTALMTGMVTFFYLRKYKLQKRHPLPSEGPVSGAEGNEWIDGDVMNSAVSDGGRYQLVEELESSHGASRYELDAGSTKPAELQDTARRELGDFRLFRR
ncbi:uncharacterized protein K452DRAFT_361121 [Aplosporella prunicola CBS 121167]|uniref:Kelch repeat protein n=1 Tax=Aplosporella prunicola CBS 121167 TaxID=1176127 RepID=A0A6A6B4U5_9PEZI|nr:uncharacterized protein K452DRAFT_361121 [Aplosporella prunicola CBS 121167]KAF2138423.1 hypothetical protein K452DRAFT_361121 [Aplosporella prunicola CBS 121167]